MPIVFACIVPTDLGAAATKTVDGVARLAERFDVATVETLIVIVGRGAVARQSIGISPGDDELSKRSAEEASRSAIPHATDRHLDRPPIIDHLGPPLESVSIVTIAASALSLRFHFDFGRALGRALAGHDRRAAIVCTAALSGASETRRARQFDGHYRDAIEGWDVKWLTHVESTYRHDASEDCLAQTAILMGALSDWRIQPRVLSYEAPAGTGLLVAAIDVLGPRRGRRG
jgi:hypothetical protein